jgi:hypothetical protein
MHNVYVIQQLIGMVLHVRKVRLIIDRYLMILSVLIDALGWEYCSVTVPCDTTRGLTCAAFNLCECDNYSYWDNVTTMWCQQKVI